MIEIVIIEYFLKRILGKDGGKALGTMERKLEEDEKRYKMLSMVPDMFYVLNTCWL